MHSGRTHKLKYCNQGKTLVPLGEGLPIVLSRNSETGTRTGVVVAIFTSPTVLYYVIILHRDN